MRPAHLSLAYARRTGTARKPCSSYRGHGSSLAVASEAKTVLAIGQWVDVVGLPTRGTEDDALGSAVKVEFELAPVSTGHASISAEAWGHA
jgi:hypothetical protein